MASSGCELKDKNNNSIHDISPQETPPVFTQEQLDNLWANNLNSADNYPFSERDLNNLKKLLSMNH